MLPDPAEDLIARAQESARLKARAELVKHLTDASLMARMFWAACSVDENNQKFAEMVKDWSAVMLKAAKVLKEDT